MTLEEFLSGLSRIILLAVAGSTVLNWARYRTRTLRDIALVFVSLTATIILGGIQDLIGAEWLWLNKLGSLAVISHPYFLLRLAQYFRPVRKSIQRAALIGLAFTWATLIISGQPLSSLITLLLIAYFVIVEAYATYILVSGASTIPGITGKRLRLVSVGSGLLALLFILGIVLLIFNQTSDASPTLQSGSASLLQLLVILSGLAYYFGFSPPRWLRRFWQLNELDHYLHRTSNRLPHDRIATFKELFTAAVRTVGGATAVVAGCDLNGKYLKIELAGEPPFQAENLEAGSDALGKAWQEQKARVAQIPKEVGADINRWAAQFNARALFIVPITGATDPWGLLIVALRYDPLFPQDDLDLLVLLAEQSAIQLDYAALSQELRSINLSLEQRVSERTIQLEKAKQAEEAIQKLNEDLKQRAIQLEAANQELESFSYSVSHDLRAPLRSIDGFSQILLEDYSEQIPAEGRDYLDRVRGAAQRMAELIDDLLNLARVTRAPLQPELINLSKMVESIARVLKEENPGRNVTFSIAPDLMETVDPHLLQIALENLLSNAWKFTSKKEQAVIEFGQDDKALERTFFIRDNGTGFDMAYVNKLFGVFQRLHSVSEFPGTGVGLATVQRIIKIHGGNIWAEAEEGKGAAFYFTL